MGDPLLPTPQTANRKSRRAMEPWKNEGKHGDGGQSSPPGLEQVAEILSGITPRELLLPMPRAEKFAANASDGWGKPLNQVVEELTSASSPVSEDSTSPSNPSDGDVSDRSSGTPGASPSSNDTGRLFPVGDRSVTLRPLPSPRANKWGPPDSHGWVPDVFKEVMPPEASSISSQEASRDHASQSATPAAGRPRRTTAGYGRSSPASFASLDLDGSWLRTYRDSSVQATLMGPPLARFSGTWPASGSMRGGTVYELPTSVLPTGGNGSSSLPTPRVSDANGAGRHGDGGMDLRTALMPTPTSRDWKDGRNPSENVESNGLLGRVVPRLMPTPTAQDASEWMGDPKRFRGTTRRKDGSRPEYDDNLAARMARFGDHTNPPSEDGSK